MDKGDMNSLSMRDYTEALVRRAFESLAGFRRAARTGPSVQKLRAG
jgi:hypothetical protein